MPRTTLADAKASRIPATLNIASTDTRFTQYLNEATEMLLKRMKPWGCYQRAVFCVTNGCIVLPRHIASVDAVWVNDRPIPIRNQWFESLESGFGLQGTDENISNESGGLQWYDRGTTCVFSEIVGTNKKLKIYTDVAEAAGTKVLLQGYDENDNWIRTLSGSTYIDGEYVTISTSPATSTNKFSVISAIQKPVTKGAIQLYEYNTSDATQRVIGEYEPDETRPDYRKVFIAGMDNVAADDDGNKYVTVEAKLDFIPVSNDTDYLLISNLTALKYACQSLQKAERNLFEESAAWEAKAMAELGHELRHFNGDGQRVAMKVGDSAIFGASGLNVI